MLSRDRPIFESFNNPLDQTAPYNGPHDITNHPPGVTTQGRQPRVTIVSYRCPKASFFVGFFGDNGDSKCGFASSQSDRQVIFFRCVDFAGKQGQPEGDRAQPTNKHQHNDDAFRKRGQVAGDAS